MTLKLERWQERIAWQKEKVHEYIQLKNDLASAVSFREFNINTDPLGLRSDRSYVIQRDPVEEAAEKLEKFKEEVLPRLREYEESEQFDVDSKLERLEWLRENKDKDLGDGGGLRQVWRRQQRNREFDELVVWKSQLKEIQ